MPARLEQVVLPGPELEVPARRHPHAARPAHPGGRLSARHRPPLRLRVLRPRSQARSTCATTSAAGTVSRSDDLPPMRVEVRSMLPRGSGEPDRLGGRASIHEGRRIPDAPGRGRGGCGPSGLLALLVLVRPRSQATSRGGRRTARPASRWPIGCGPLVEAGGRRSPASRRAARALELTPRLATGAGGSTSREDGVVARGDRHPAGRTTRRGRSCAASRTGCTAPAGRPPTSTWRSSSVPTGTCPPTSSSERARRES